MNDVLIWLEQHPGLAGYVQAMGSLVALYAAFLIPAAQRRSLEHAAGLRLGGLVEQCFEALMGAQREFFPDYCRDPDAYYVPGQDETAPDPAKAVRELARAVDQLERVSLFELKPQCRALINDLKGEMSRASAHAKGYLGGDFEAQGFDEGALEGYEGDSYPLMLAIMKFVPGAGDKKKYAPGAGDKWLVERLRHEICLIAHQRAEQSQALRQAGIRRVNVRRTLRSRISNAWRSLRVRLSWRMAA